MPQIKYLLLTNIITLTLGLLLGNKLFSNTPQPEPQTHPTTPTSMDMMIHTHELYELPQTETSPTLHIELTKDNKTGYNLHLITTDFNFNPQSASTDHQPNQGHAHVYIDEQKHARVYSPWFHLPIDDQPHTIKVTLNTNDHKEYAINGQSISQTITLPVKEATPTATP